MKESARYLTGFLVAAFLLTGAIANSGMAQEKAKDAKAASATKAEKEIANITMLMENDKVEVLEILVKPGDEYKAEASASPRVIRALKGGKLLRTEADGKTQNVEWKTGQVRFFPTVTPHTGKNIGKFDLLFYIVVLK